jgi:hypothetical protein
MPGFATGAVASSMSALPPIATSIAFFGISALGHKRTRRHVRALRSAPLALAFFALARGVRLFVRRGPRFFFRGAGFGGTSSRHSLISCCLVPLYLLRSRLPSLSPGMPSHSPCSVYCQSHHCGNVAFGQLGVPDVYCASQSRYCDSSESRLSPSCSFSTWPE